MNKKILLGLTTVAVLGLVYTGCKKDKDETTADTEFASNNELSESSSNDAENFADDVAKGQGSGSFRTSSSESMMGGCATITHDTVSNPRVMTIDFGTTNCVCNDGRSRRGKIVVTYSGKYFEAGSSKSMTFNEYYVNDNKVEGTKSIVNNGKNNSGHSTWTISADLTITKSNGKVHSWSSTRTREMIAGEGTKTRLDDIYSITGSASGDNKKGITYTATIVKPLVRALACRWFQSGSIDFNIGTKPTRTLDYGNGDCDAQATVTVDGKTYPITLR